MKFEDQIDGFMSRKPSIAASAFVAPHVFLHGDIEIGDEASIWPQCSLRGDIAPIRIGAHSNVQDGCVVHVADDLPTIIGEWVTVGHQATVHACTLEDEVLIGMGAIILDGAHIGSRSIVGANSTVTGHTRIPTGSLVLGTPAKVVRALTREEQDGIRVWAERYVILSRRYLADLARE